MSLSDREWTSFIPTSYLPNRKSLYNGEIWVKVNEHGENWLKDRRWVDEHVHDIFPVGEFIMVIFKSTRDRWDMTLYQGELI